MTADGHIKWALVTGGSSGLGMEFSKLLARDGYGVIIVAKPPDELERAERWFQENMPDARIVCRQMDLALPESAKALHDWTREQGYAIEILINNAGFATYGTFREIPVEKDLAMINLMVVTNFLLTRYFMNDMADRNTGRILITSSTGALLPAPRMSAYSAAKIFCDYYGLAYGEELKMLRSNVSITVLLPPMTRTGFQQTSGMAAGMFSKGNPLAYDADFVARKAYRALLKGKRFILPGRLMSIPMKLVSPLASHFNVLLLLKLARRIAR